MRQVGLAGWLSRRVGLRCTQALLRVSRGSPALQAAVEEDLRLVKVCRGHQNRLLAGPAEILERLRAQGPSVSLCRPLRASREPKVVAKQLAQLAICG